MKRAVSHQSSRAGFMILMLIAFTSIILGLSVTFYLYCSRGMEDGRIAIKIANQRLALRGAINYLAALSPALPAPPPCTRPNANPLLYATPVTVDLNGTTARSAKLGWYRIRQSSVANFVYVTVGVGPSNGIQTPTAGSPAGWTDDSWHDEYRTWYHVELDAMTASAPASPPYPAVIRSITQVAPPASPSDW